MAVHSIPRVTAPHIHRGRKKHGQQLLAVDDVSYTQKCNNNNNNNNALQ